jgi:chromosome segregation ATPase
MAFPAGMGTSSGGSFYDDPKMDAEFEALVTENEAMLIEISHLKRREANSAQKMNELEETCARLREEVDSLQEFCKQLKNEPTDDFHAEHQDLLERYENLRADNERLQEDYYLLQETVKSEVEENLTHAPHRASDDAQRIDRILKELRAFHSSQQMSVGHLRRCGITPSTIKDKVPSECEKNLSMLRKLVDSSRRLTSVSSEDDDIVVLVKGLVGEVSLAGASALQDTLTTFGDFLGISSSGGAASSAGHQDPAAPATTAKTLGFWRGK